MVDGYSLQVDFEVDNCELDGQTNETSFVLGVELAFFYQRLKADPSEFSETVHAANVKRLQSLAAKQGRKSSATWAFNGVPCEGWCVITVSPKRTLTLVR